MSALYEDKPNRSTIQSSPLIDPSMDWKEALAVVDNMVRQNLVDRVPNYPPINCKAILDQYTPNQLISAWLIVSRGYSD
tara:strand:- start:737 stop:973 length:237 start_codon:yes stop_codon:yes gene_type:complete